MLLNNCLQSRRRSAIKCSQHLSFPDKMSSLYCHCQCYNHFLPKCHNCCPPHHSLCQCHFLLKSHLCSHFQSKCQNRYILITLTVNVTSSQNVIFVLANFHPGFFHQDEPPCIVAITTLVNDSEATKKPGTYLTSFER